MTNLLNSLSPSIYSPDLPSAPKDSTMTDAEKLGIFQGENGTSWFPTPKRSDGSVVYVNRSTDGTLAFATRNQQGSFTHLESPKVDASNLATDNLVAVSPIPQVRSRHKVVISQENQNKLKIVENLKIKENSYVRVVLDTNTNKAYYLFSTGKADGSAYRLDMFQDDINKLSLEQIRNQAKDLLSNNPDLKTFLISRVEVPTVLPIPTVKPRKVPVVLPLPIVQTRKGLMDPKYYSTVASLEVQPNGGPVQKVNILKRTVSLPGQKAHDIYAIAQPGKGLMPISVEIAGTPFADITKRLSRYVRTIYGDPREKNNVPPNSRVAAQSANLDIKKRMTGDFIAYGAIGIDRPISNLLSLAKGAFNAVAGKFPLAGKFTEIVAKYTRRSEDGKADAVRLEFDGSLLDKSGVFHIKVNLSQLLKLRKPDLLKVFDELNVATRGNPQAEVEVKGIRKIIEDYYGKPGFVDSKFAKQTDLRLTFDDKGFRAGFLSYAILSNPTAPLLLAGSVRMKFDNNRNILGGQLIVVLEKDTKSTPSGVWGGVGAGFVVQWNGGPENAPIRKNSKGQLGIEVDYNNKKHFLVVPQMADIMRFNSLGDPSNVKPTMASAITSETIAREVLKTNDPKVISQLEATANAVENGGKVIEKATEVCGVLSAASAVGTLAGGLSMGGLLLAGAGAVAINLLWVDGVADATLTGFTKRSYANDSQLAYNELKKLDARLSDPSPLTVAEKNILLNSVSILEELGAKWSKNASETKTSERNYKKFYDDLPTEQKIPWSSNSTDQIKKWIKNHR